MAKKRIYVPVSESEYEFIQTLAEADNRSLADKSAQILRAGLDAGLESISDKREKDLVSFGNYLLKKHNVVTDGVGDWDLDKWRNEQKA